MSFLISKFSIRPRGRSSSAITYSAQVYFCSIHTVHPVDVSVNAKYKGVNLSIRRLVAIVRLTLCGLMLLAAGSNSETVPSATAVKCIHGTCQYFNENARSVVLEDGQFVSHLKGEEAANGELTEAEKSEFNDMPEEKAGFAQVSYRDQDSGDYQYLLGSVKATNLVGHVAAGGWKDLFARYSGTVYVDGSPAPGGTQVRFRIPSQDEPLVDISPTAGLHPSWSPDGKKIVFSSARGGNSEIYVMHSDGSGMKRLTNNQVDDVLPSWSPDGKKIIFASWRDGNYEIYVMHANGSNQIRLTDNSDWDKPPSWSPDGTKIAFISDQHGDYEIYVVNAYGYGQTRVTNNKSGDVLPSWAPDGKKIAFISDRDGNYEIYVMHADSSGEKRLTDQGYDLFPSWSPDGKKIAFHSYQEGNFEIYVMQAGSAPSQIVEPLYTVPKSDRIDTVTFGTAATSSDGGFSSNVWFSIPDTALKLTDDDRLAVDVILLDGRTTHAADVRWAEGLIKTLTLNVRTETPTLPNTPPTVTIASPSHGALLLTTDSISFTGSATDAQDGSLTGTSLVWTSSSDGQLGTGGSITATLSAGAHQITLTATNRQRAQGNSSLGVIVKAPIPVGPVALPPAIESVLPHVFAGTVTIRGQPAPDGTKVSVWVSDYDAPVGTETVSGGKYSVLVLKYGHAFAGKTLMFKIADKDTGSTTSWESGGATVLNLATD